MRDYTFANHCLESWARWTIDTNGFPERSPILKFGESSTHLSMSTIPCGVEPRNRSVETAITILGLMRRSCAKSAERAHILKMIAIERQGGDSLAKTLSRLKIKRTKYYEALDEFASRLEVLIYYAEK